MFFINRIPPEGIRIGPNTYQAGQLKTILIGISVILFFFSSTIGTVFWIVGMSSILLFVIFIYIFGSKRSWRGFSPCLIYPPPTLPHSLTHTFAYFFFRSHRCQRRYDSRTRCSDAGGCRGRVRFCRLKERNSPLPQSSLSYPSLTALFNKSTPHSFILYHFFKGSFFKGSDWVVGTGYRSGLLRFKKIFRYHCIVVQRVYIVVL